MPPIRANCPWLVSSPFNLRPGAHRPFTKEPSSMERTPAMGSPGVFGAKVTFTCPLPAMKYSPGPAEMTITPTGGGPAGAGAGAGVAGAAAPGVAGGGAGRRPLRG